MDARSITILVLLCICFVGVPILAFVAGIIYMWHYMSPDDAKQAWIPKIIFLIAFVLGVVSILLMPFDIAQAKMVENEVLTFILGIIWQLFFTVITIMVLVVVPFATFYYEAQNTDHEGCSGVLYQARCACIITSAIVIVSTVIILVSYFFLGFAEISYVSYRNGSPQTSFEDAILNVNCDTCSYEFTQYEVFASIIVYIIAYLSLLGWIAFILFGGCGLSALPIGSIKAFIKRPRMMKSEDFTREKEEIKNMAEKLIELGEKLAQKKAGYRNYMKFKKASAALENYWLTVQKRFYKGGGSIIFALLQLFYGIFAFAVSAIWVIHIILYLGLPEYVFQFGLLNYLFHYTDKITVDFPIVGAFLYTFFIFHLILAVLKGMEILGRRFDFINAYPLIPGNTLMNALLFNVGVFLLCTVTANQFAARAFSQYTTRTALETIFGGAINNLRGIKFVFQYVHYAFLLAVVIGTVLSIIDAFLPDSSNNIEKQKKKLDELMQSID